MAIRIGKTVTLFMVFFLGVYLTTTQAQDKPAAVRPRQSEAGTTWIQNRNTRVELLSNAAAAWWGLFTYRWNTSASSWEKFFQGGFGGGLPEAEMKRYREKWKVYDLFERVVPTQVRTMVADDAATMRFRLLAREDVWADFTVKIIGESPMVLFDVTARSRPDLVANGGQQFSQPMTYLLTDDPADPARWKELSAREQRNVYKWGYGQRYVAAYRPGSDLFYAFFWPKADKVRGVMFATGPLSAGWLEAPYVLYGGYYAHEDAADVHAYAEMLHSYSKVFK